MPQGTPTREQGRNRRLMARTLEEKYPEYQPVVSMATHAIELDKQVEDTPKDTDLRLAAITAHDKVASYLTPKLKAIELTGEDGGPIRAILANEDTKL